ncbi:helix-turn-helix domain-containing protein [Lactiplantibacillus sp. WILCCON 0030]|uniref:Helix-turn-helix domain-containing protein n=1 Tax=Lactiplantibacillus brownii TaxID=3069269 RepID=A0ABU1AEH5_9LACO|nr:helix-turn-helix domain-containing protein [Lactiplantibacillus brownii]MDQ7938707.1 helix-turn-helix domain-containing protein [Lactiplantibacillus brownii]
MNVQQLQLIYPQATVVTAPIVKPNTVCIRLAAEKYLCIETAKLGRRELSLLELLTQTKAPQAAIDTWSNFLTGEATVAPHTTAKQLQLLHFQVRFTDDSQHHHQWLAALSDLFNDVVHRTFTTENDGYLLLADPISPLTQPDLTGLLDLLDNDFYTNTHLFIGSRHGDVQTLPAAYRLERQLFEQNHKQAVGTLSSAMLPYLATVHHTALDTLTNELLTDPDNQQLITALYQTQGNVRQAAAHLFLHRNTLLYRIDKFERCSGFNLKAMDDLVYCYLLTLAQTNN